MKLYLKIISAGAILLTLRGILYPYLRTIPNTEVLSLLIIIGVPVLGCLFGINIAKDLVKCNKVKS